MKLPGGNRVRRKSYFNVESVTLPAHSPVQQQPGESSADLSHDKLCVSCILWCSKIVLTNIKEMCSDSHRLKWLLLTFIFQFNSETESCFRLKLLHVCQSCWIRRLWDHMCKYHTAALTWQKNNPREKDSN